MDLAVQVLDGPGHRVERFVGAIPEKAGALPEEPGHQPEQAQLPLRQTGQKAPSQEQGGLRGQGGDLPQNPSRVLRIRRHRPGIEQRHHNVLAGTKSGGGFFIEITVKNAGKKSVKASIIIIDDFHNISQYIQRWLRRCPPSQTGGLCSLFPKRGDTSCSPKRGNHAGPCERGGSLFSEGWWKFPAQEGRNYSPENTFS